jgi:polysaccharide deacetylase family sporulation protein PdaB
MAARTGLFPGRFLPFSVLIAVLLALLVMSACSSAPRTVLARQTKTPATPTSTPTPAPSPTPQPPLVYLMAHGNLKIPEIALTFDDGPSSGYTQAILNVLRQYQVPATFFMLGIWVQRYPDLARAVVAAGHAVGDHTWNHLNLTTLTASQVNQQLSNTRTAIQKVTGVVTTLFRPPYMAYNRQVLTIAHSLKFSTILWSIDPHDWERPGVGPIISTVLGHAQNGSIILMHDGGGDRSQTVKALSTIIPRLHARGFTFVTVPQMLLHLAAASQVNLADQTAPAAPGALPALQPGPDSLSEPFTDRRMPPRQRRS